MKRSTAKSPAASINAILQRGHDLLNGYVQEAFSLISSIQSWKGVKHEKEAAQKVSGQKAARRTDYGFLGPDVIQWTDQPPEIFDKVFARSIAKSFLVLQSFETGINAFRREGAEDFFIRITRFRRSPFRAWLGTWHSSAHRAAEFIGDVVWLQTRIALELAKDDYDFLRRVQFPFASWEETWSFRKEIGSTEQAAWLEEKVRAKRDRLLYRTMCIPEMGKEQAHVLATMDIELSRALHIPRASFPVAEANPGTQPVLKPVEVAILKYLSETPRVAKVQEDIAAGVHRDRVTVGPYLKRLRSYGLVRRPNGEKGGEVITPRGITLYQQICQQPLAPPGEKPALS